MKSKVFKIGVVLIMILTMTITNFIFVGSSLISYALDSNTNTNNNNVEFNVYFKNEKGEQVSDLDVVPSNHDIMLYMYLNVKQEGYLNGSISLDNETNFKLVESDNQYVEKVEDNTVKLYNITAGSSVEIPVKIEPIRDENYRVGLLDMESKITLNGIYRDRSEKDKKIKATKTVKLNLIEEAKQEDVINEVSIITNKVSNINGEEKRVVQLSWNVGTKSNSYPIKEMLAKIDAPKVGEVEPQVETQVNLNTMTSYESHIRDGVNEITLTNQEKEGNVTWKNDGTENIILTYLYDKEVVFHDITIEPELKITFYNQKEITTTSQIVMNQEEKDSVITIETENQENEIYKGKIVAGIDRQYITRTNVKVNLAKMVNDIVVQENESTYTANEAENAANILYSQTLISKEKFDKILGENGNITILDQANQVIGTIDVNTQVNENGFMVLDYGNSEIKAIKMQITKPVEEGTLEINHIKTVKGEQNPVVKVASRIHNVISCQYNQGIANQVENNIQLKDTITESKIALDTDQLSTVISNHVAMKITLLSNEEKYDLFENPNFTITLPNQVEGINITNISKLYDDNNELEDTIQYAVNGNQINLVLKGKQGNYTSTVEGITLVVEADIQVSKTAATSEEQIAVAYQNANAVTYANDGIANAPIKITAPKEITTVNSIHDLSVETIGEEEKKDVMMEKGADAKQIEANMEIINSNVSAIKDVKILGDFPTDDQENNMGIVITQGIQVEGVENAQVYYSENENPTDDITDVQNGWSENLDGLRAKSYLVLLDTVAPQSSVQANYRMAIPENLEYNKVATEGYSINATNSETEMEIKLASTTIAMQTGVGPKVESAIQATVGADVLKENDVVKNGEVIQYQVKVSNTGTEVAKDIKVIGGVPEGTTLVEPMQHYEYTGAAYYQEKPEAKSPEGTIQELKPGESQIVKYEVRVNKEVKAGTTIKNEVEVQYGEARNKSTITNITEASNVRVSIKRITDRSQGIYIGDNIKYYAIIENMSNTEQKDVTIQTNLSDNAEVSDLTLISGMTVEEITGDDLGVVNPNVKPDIEKSENGDHSYNPDEHVKEEVEDNNDDSNVSSDNEQKLTYRKEVNIGNLASGETKVLYYSIKSKNSSDINFSIIAKVDKVQSRSNLWQDTILFYNMKSDMKTNTESEFVEIGDEIDYYITVENLGTANETIKVVDNIPTDLEIKSITVNGEEKEIPKTSNQVNVFTGVNPKATANIEIKTRVGYHEDVEAKTIKNFATVVDGSDNEISTTSEITHIIKGDSSNDGNNGNDGNDGDNNDNQDSNNNNTNNGTNGDPITNPQRNNMIAGIAWVDSNTNGVKNAGEPLLAGVTAKLLNVETNEIVKDSSGNEITTTTNSDGMYVLQNVANGKYIVIFEYDKTKYGLTTYQVSGASESETSKAVMNELSINGTTSKVASTDILTIGNSDIANINIGLIELKNFDLKLEKGIKRILIQNTAGSTVREYDNVDMAKVELDAKKVKGSTVLIEYNIKVSNVGEVDGYAKKIVDYMPNDLKFSSELNKDWYQTNGSLYNASLANEKIGAGETKNLTLTLTKSMTENNTGLTTNVAEIAEDYNELGLKDSNSTPGNKAQGENDISSADVIISIRTGGMLYVSIIVTAIAIATAITILILKIRKQDDEDLTI